MDDLTALLVAATVSATAACAADIRPDSDVDAGDGDAAPVGKVSTVRNADGTYTTRVDAMSLDAWTHVDVETGGESDAGGAWDFAAQRFHVKLNGGISGMAGVEVSPQGAALSDVNAVPVSGWITDAADGDDANEDPDYAFEQGDGWYAYDVTSHVLTPRPLVWVIRTGDDAVVKLAIEDYYDDAGTSGVFTLHWAPL
jgi:hypothetical protein